MKQDNQSLSVFMGDAKKGKVNIKASEKVAKSEYKGQISIIYTKFTCTIGMPVLKKTYMHNVLPTSATPPRKTYHLGWDWHKWENHKVQF